MGVLRGVAKVPRTTTSKYGTRPRPGRRQNKPVSSGSVLPPVLVSAVTPELEVVSAERAEAVLTQAEAGAGAGQQSEEWLRRLESDCNIE